MVARPDAGNAVSIAVNELRLGYRKVRERGFAQQAALIVAALFFVGVTVGGTWAAHVAGSEYATDPDATGGLVGLVPAAVGVFFLFMTAYLIVVQYGEVDSLDGHLTTVPARDVVGGLLVAGFVRVVGLFGAPLVVAAAGFAVGAGAPGAAPVAAFAVLALATTAFLLGFPLGVAIKYMLSRSAFVERHKVGLGVSAFVAYFALIITETVDEVVGPLVVAAEGSPVAWYSDLALVALPGGGSLPRAAAVLAGSAVVGAVAVLASVRLCERHWYGDRADVGGRETDSATGGRLDAVLGRRTAWVARKSWLRARRAPVKVLFAAYPAFVLFNPLQQSVEAGHPTAGLATTAVLYSAWATGALFTLNPLGDEGAVLPVAATAGVSGREFVGGLVAASALVGTPVTVALAVGLGVLSPLPPLAVGTTAVAALVLPALAAAVATGVGTAFPKYETTTVTRSREAVVPSMWAFSIYTIVFVLTAGVATGLQNPAAAELLTDQAGFGAEAIQLGGLVVGVALAAGVAALALRAAVRAFDGYTSDR